VKGYVAAAWRPDPRYWRYALRQALPLTLTSLFINLYFRIDMTLLARWRPVEELGWYSAAHKCIEVLMVVPAVLVAASFPGFARLFQEDRARLAEAARKLLRLLLALALPLTAGAILVAGPIMRALFGQAYAPSGIALAWLMPALGLIFLNYPLSFLLIAGHKQGVNALFSGLAVVVSIGANSWLIPRYGYGGAAAAACLTEVALFVAYAASVQRLLFPLRLGGALWRTGLATAAMALPVWLLRTRAPWIPVASGTLVYAAAARSLGLLRVDDLALPRWADWDRQDG
jgi:O-antigen/teichoic acid export membrane protein